MHLGRLFLQTMYQNVSTWRFVCNVFCVTDVWGECIQVILFVPDEDEKITGWVLSLSPVAPSGTHLETREK